MSRQSTYKNRYLGERETGAQKNRGMEKLRQSKGERGKEQECEV
jgi:hypothetical protein